MELSQMNASTFSRGRLRISILSPVSLHEEAHNVNCAAGSDILCDTIAVRGATRRHNRGQRLPSRFAALQCIAQRSACELNATSLIANR